MIRELTHNLMELDALTAKYLLQLLVGINLLSTTRPLSHVSSHCNRLLVRGTTDVTQSLVGHLLKTIGLDVVPESSDDIRSSLYFNAEDALKPWR